MYLSLRFDFEAISSTEEGGNRPIQDYNTPCFNILSYHHYLFW